ncbi:unnamed protein product [Ixodes pacificus]
MASFSAIKFYGKKEMLAALLIPRGEVSDVEMESSDEKELMRAKNNEKNTHTYCRFEIEDTSAALPQWRSRRNCSKEPLVCKKVDIAPVNVEFREKFSPPAGELLSPYQYFKMFCDTSIFENFTLQTNLY